MGIVAMMLVIGKIRACVVAAAIELEVKEEDIWTRSLRPEVCEARRLAFWAATKVGKASQRIGEVMGRDHSTVIVGVQRVKQKRATSPHYHRLSENVLALAERIIQTKRSERPVPRQRRIACGLPLRSARVISHARRNHLGQHQGPPNWYEGRGAE